MESLWHRQVRWSGLDPVAARQHGEIFDLTLPLVEAAAGYEAMDERRAIQVLLTL